jgi:hypothetical protein
MSNLQILANHSFRDSDESLYTVVRRWMRLVVQDLWGDRQPSDEDIVLETLGRNSCLVDELEGCDPPEWMYVLASREMSRAIWVENGYHPYCKFRCYAENHSSKCSSHWKLETDQRS